MTWQEQSWWPIFNLFIDIFATHIKMLCSACSSNIVRHEIAPTLWTLTIMGRLFWFAHLLLLDIKHYVFHSFGDQYTLSFNTWECNTTLKFILPADRYSMYIQDVTRNTAPCVLIISTTAITESGWISRFIFYQIWQLWCVDKRCNFVL